MFLTLQQLQTAAGVSTVITGNRPPAQEDNIFDDDDDETEEPFSPEPIAPGVLLPIEKQILHLPSNGNVTGNFHSVELTLREDQAARHLSRLRELIADKSFQYSHVIRDAPRKDVSTRARSVIKKLDREITRQCRMYTLCHSRLCILGADDRTLDKYRLLSKEDVKASTAVLDPNTPGSTNLRLSWIWCAHHAGAGAGAGAPSGSDDSPARLLECKHFQSLISNVDLITS